MSDLISRQAAIRAVNTALFPKIYTAKDAEKALRDLPPAQPQWIPCSERLPKQGEPVLIYFIDMPYIAWYNHADKKWRTDDFELDADYEPKEWLQLPIPKRG